MWGEYTECMVRSRYHAFMTMLQFFDSYPPDLINEDVIDGTWANYLQALADHRAWISENIYGRAANVG